MVKKSTYLVLFCSFIFSSFSGNSQEVATLPDCITPTASFTSVASCSGKPFKLINSSTNTNENTTYQWDLYSDGVVDVTTQNATFTITQPGSYNVKLTVINEGGCSSSDTRTIQISANPIASIAEFSHVYIGYSPFETSLLNGSATGGTGPYQYSWIGSTSTSNSIEVGPKVTTTYHFTVKDANGCSGTTSATVKVTDVRCGPKMDKVTLCSPKGTSCVNQSQVPGYLNKGWTLGPCPTKTTTKSATATADTEVSSASVADVASELAEEKNIKVLNNPTPGFFKVQLNNYLAKTEIEIVSSNGNTVERRTVNAGSSSLQSFNLTNKASGIYLVKVVTGTEVKLARVLVAH